MKTLLLFIIGIISAVTYAQDGSLDTSFGDNGIVRTDIDGDYDFPTSLVQQADENLVVAGSFTNEGHRFPSIVRYLPDGSIDTTFGDNGLVVYDNPEYENQYYEKILSQNDGKIIAGAAFYHNSENIYAAHRYLSDGSIDTDYGANGEIIVSSEWVTQGDMILQSDGSLLVVCSSFENGLFNFVLKRFLPNGTLDINFGDNGAVIGDGVISSMLDTKIGLTDNEKIVVLANYYNTGNSTKVLLRFNNNGSYDNSFGTDGIAAITIDQKYRSIGMAIYNDGKIAVHSGYIDYQSYEAHTLISRYLSNGDLDISFGDSGYINPDIDNMVIVKILAQDNQRLLTYGTLIADFQEGGGPSFMNRYKLGGSLDSTFIFESSPALYYQADMILQQDGKIVCLMTTPWYVGNEDIIMKRYFNNPLNITEFQNQKTTVYPNPSSGIFTVEREFYFEKEVYQITDITGKIIASGELNDKQSQIDLSAAQTGIYFLKTSNGVFRLLKN
ncbi:T9SS type A sorting domain-containing protein [Aequorivita todarodis]|uniref:T9SS type A sorting domain-containing protein n=1 Tax=Aequorivita todarodis TaxID=2036821 RepID=UPI0023509AD9|nr:T9SS type A sorting domain-containing protein [Aequorivita todarodis]MDC8000904.1 T9SS type A sorting domain-containing protein [Aequorivita todarodis]